MFPFLISREETFFLILLRNMNREASPRVGKMRAGIRVRGREREREPGQGWDDRDLQQEESRGARKSVKATQLGQGKGLLLAGNCKDELVDSG